MKQAQSVLEFTLIVAFVLIFISIFLNSFKLKGVLYRNGAIPVCIKALPLIHLYYTITLCINYEQRMKKNKTND